MGLPPVGSLRLRGAPHDGPHVAWDEHVVDNEGLGRKKSKSTCLQELMLEDIYIPNAEGRLTFSVCCIYHRPRPFDESSDEDSSGSESGSDVNGTAKPIRQHCRHRHQVDGEWDGDRYGEPENKRGVGATTGMHMNG